MMSFGTIIIMGFFLCFFWGGFILTLFMVVKKEKQKVRTNNLYKS